MEAQILHDNEEKLLHPKEYRKKSGGADIN
jgi:hypothetical protein